MPDAKTQVLESQTEFFDQLWSLMQRAPKEQGWSRQDVYYIIKGMTDEGLSGGVFTAWAVHKFGLATTHALTKQLRDKLTE